MKLSKLILNLKMVFLIYSLKGLMSERYSNEKLNPDKFHIMIPRTSFTVSTVYCDRFF